MVKQLEQEIEEKTPDVPEIQLAQAFRLIDSKKGKFLFQ